MLCRITTDSNLWTIRSSCRRKTPSPAFMLGPRAAERVAARPPYRKYKRAPTRACVSTGTAYCWKGAPHMCSECILLRSNSSLRQVRAKMVHVPRVQEAAAALRWDLTACGRILRSALMQAVRETLVRRVLTHPHAMP